MIKQVENQVFAGIDIGSHALRMKIGEVKRNGTIKNLEFVRKPISLGKDTYTMGKVSFETVDKTCETLKGFKQLMLDYDVKDYRAVVTSAIREAKNRDYIIDQIKLKTGLHIDVISNAEERMLVYKSIKENLPNEQKVINEGTLIVDIGSGNVEISAYTQGLLKFSQYIKLGSLRLREILSSIEGRTLNFPKILEEYIASNIDMLKDCWIETSFANFVALGGNIRIISKLCNSSKKNLDIQYIKREDFIKHYEKLLHMPSHVIVQNYCVLEERVDVFIPAMMIFKMFLDMTDAKGIYVPNASLSDGILYDLIDQKHKTKRRTEIIDDVIASARILAKRYRYDQAHAEDVEQKALKIFDALSVLHGLGERERLLLQLATILHDIGKFISMNEHYKHSYSVIIASNFIGISKEELEIIANVARYHSKLVPAYSHENFYRLSEKNRVIVAKLVAMIRMADALDRSHRQKIKRINIELQEKKVIIKADAVEDTLLEKWTFDGKSEFFQEVFGVTPILKIKRKIVYE